jgi:hypothetical protein
MAEEKIILSGDIIWKKAEFFWHILSIYKDLEMPAFSNG